MQILSQDTSQEIRNTLLNINKLFNKNLLRHFFCANYRLTTKHYLYCVQPKGTGYQGCRHWGRGGGGGAGGTMAPPYFGRSVNPISN